MYVCVFVCLFVKSLLTSDFWRFFEDISLISKPMSLIFQGLTMFGKRVMMNPSFKAKVKGQGHGAQKVEIM